MTTGKTQTVVSINRSGCNYSHRNVDCRFLEDGWTDHDETFRQFGGWLPGGEYRRCDDVIDHTVHPTFFPNFFDPQIPLPQIYSPKFFPLKFFGQNFSPTNFFPNIFCPKFFDGHSFTYNFLSLHLLGTLHFLPKFFFSRLLFSVIAIRGGGWWEIRWGTTKCAAAR